MNIIFEKMDDKHRKPIMDIYNYYVKTGTAAFPEAPLPEEAYDRFLTSSYKYPAYAVISDEDKCLLGFCMLSDYIPHSSFRSTASLTYFIAPDFVGKGIGGKCLEKLETEAVNMGISNLIADISSENTGSINFHKKHGFSVVGELNGIGSKFGRDFGVVLMQKKV